MEYNIKSKIFIQRTEEYGGSVQDVDGLVQERRSSSALAMELCLS